MNIKGFTLIELMVVIIIMGLVAAFSVPAIIKSLPTTRINSTADDIKMNLTLARSKAISEGTAYLGIFAVAGTSFNIVKDANADGAYTAGETIKTLSLSNGITIDSTVATVAFSPRGDATLTGVIRILNIRGEHRRIFVLTSGSVIRQ